MDKNLEKWLDTFKKEKGRPLKVLHVGNVANNAYLNAKFLRSHGVDADVLSNDYYHVMGCPEWEDIEIIYPYGSDFKPSFSFKDTKNYIRPYWFIQAPLDLCALLYSKNKLLARIAKMIISKPYSWIFLFTLIGFYKRSLRIPGYIERKKNGLKNLYYIRTIKLVINKNMAIGGVRFYFFYILKTIVSFFEGVISGVAYLIKAIFFPIAFLTNKSKNNLIKQKFNLILKDFEEVFPKRKDILVFNEVLPWFNNILQFNKIISKYDIIQCYGTSPIYALLSGKKPYVAFEHGTLRDFTMNDDPIHRLTALAYRLADHVFITNGDCLEYANKLGIKKYSAMIHPVDIKQHRQIYPGLKKEIKEKYNADLLFICPVRHDFKIKGTDIHVKAIQGVKELFSDLNVKFLFVEWGNEVEKSKKIIRECGCEKNVEWLGSLSRITLIKLMQASDVVLDQMALPHFGSTAPQAIAAGIPVISSYKPESTRWIVAEDAPILPAFTSDEVIKAIKIAVNPVWLEEYKLRAEKWIDEYHSPQRIINEHLKVYKNIMGKKHA